MRKTFADPYETWQLWFAWRPVYVGRTRVWREHVYRKLRMYGHDAVWEYKFPEDVPCSVS